jgi:hypothetical protein
MRSFIIDGQRVHFHLEQNSGGAGGMILCTLVEQSDNTVLAFRHWYESNEIARVAYERTITDIAEQRRRIARALQTGVSGKLHEDA